jgi:hypothetical protein
VGTFVGWLLGQGADIPDLFIAPRAGHNTISESFRSSIWSRREIKVQTSPYKGEVRRGEHSSWALLEVEPHVRKRNQPRAPKESARCN